MRATRLHVHAEYVHMYLSTAYVHTYGCGIHRSSLHNVPFGRGVLGNLGPTTCICGVGHLVAGRGRWVEGADVGVASARYLVNSCIEIEYGYS